MCGIFGILGKHDYSQNDLDHASCKGSQRGPEHSILTKITESVTLGFHRLAINGLDALSSQPIKHQGSYLVCNGEIYNYRELYHENNLTPTTNSDCEVILHLYKKYGIEYTLRLIDGVFSFILVDTESNQVFVARDPYGVRPLFMLKSQNEEYYGFASEMKQLTPLVAASHEQTEQTEHTTLEQFQPGSFSVFTLDTQSTICLKETSKYSYFPFMTKMEIPYPSEYTLLKYLDQLKHRLCNAVKKRVDTTERPIACLLSGGLDSSLITALVAQEFDDPSKLETYSIGMNGSEDIVYAEKVAQYLGTSHTSIILNEEDFLNAIPEVIYAIESYDTTTVRASVGNFLVAKYIKEHSQAKVIFNGDGSDELTGGYLYFHKCPSSTEFDAECRRLLSNIHYFDVLRSDRTISYHGLEARTPFLDRAFVEHYLTFPKEIRDHNKLKMCEKYLLREAFTSDNLLPSEVLWRTKEAFSDGVSSQKKAWFETIQENIPESALKYTFHADIPNPPKTAEQRYYRGIFEEHYPNRGNTIPYFWMPKYTNTEDSSARTLEFYNSLVKN